MATVETRFTTAGVPETQAAFGNVARGMSSVSDASGVMASSLDFLKTSVVTAISAFAAWTFTKYIEGAAMLAAKVETLGAVMKVVGNNAGYTGSQMDLYSKQIQKMGITTNESLNSAVKMASAQMDLSKASQLARVAQDAATIGGINSSEAFGRMIDGIRSGEVDILKTLGINIQLEQAHKKYAESLGRTKESLSATEKTQANMNAVLEYGKNIAGAYEAAMGTAGKQMSSLVRPAEEIKLSLGTTFTPALNDAVRDLYGVLTYVSEALKNNKDVLQDVGFWFKYAYFVAKTAVLELVNTFYVAAIAANKLGGAIASALYLLQGGSLNGNNPFAGTVKWFEDNINGLQKKVTDINTSISKSWDGLGNFGTNERTAAQEQASIDAAAARKAKEAADARKAAQEAGAKAAEDWRKTYADLRKSIEELNPAMDVYSRKILDTNNKYTDLMHKKGANITLLKQLRDEHLAGIQVRKQMDKAIAQNKIELDEYKAILEANAAADKAYWLDIASTIKTIQSMQPGAAFDALTEQIEKFQDIARRFPDMAAQVSVAVLKLKSDFSSSSGLDALLQGNTAINTSLIEDPHERQKQQITDRYEFEKSQQDKALKLAEKDADKRAAIEKRLSLLKQQYTADITKNTDHSFRSQLSMASQYTGMAGQFFSTLASTQDQSSRSGFESAKAFSIAAATMSTAAAVMNALATVQPYPMALAAAALAAATGVIQIAQIASTTFGGGGGVVAPPSGSFSSSGGGATGSGAGSSVSAPLQSVHDQQTAAQLDRVAASMDNAAVAMGKASKTFLDIGELFKTGAMAMLMNIVPGKYTNTTDNSTSFVKDYYLGTGLKTQLGIALAPLKLLKGDFKGFLDALNPVNWVSDIGKGLFGGSWALSGAGITSQLVNGQYRVGSYTTEHKDGGLFGSDKDRTNYGNNVDPAFSKGMTQFFDGLKLNLLRGAASFGLNAVTTEAGFAKANTNMGTVATAGRSSEDIQKDWEAQVQAASDALTKTIPGLAELSLGGENATDTLARLSTAMMNVNDALALVGAALIPSAGVITDTAYQLQQLFGGAEEMATAMDDYFSAMYTDSEQSAMKAAAAQRTVNLGFSEINNTLAGAAIQIPKTNAEFNALRNSVTDPSLFAALTLLGPTFAEITKQAEQLVAGVTSFSVDLISRELKASGQSGLADLYDLKKQQELEMKDAITNGMDTQWLAIVQQKELDAVMKNSLDEAVKNVANAQKTLDDLAAKAHMDVMQTTSNALLKAAADLKSRLVSILDIRTSATQTLITLLGGNLSLSTLYTQKKAEFERTRLLSESGDTAAMKALPEVVSSFVDVSKQYASSRSVFESDLASGKQALAVLAGIPATADLTLENARLQLLKLEEIREATSTGTVEQRSLLSDMSGGLTGMQSLLSDFLAATVSAQQSSAALAAAQAAAAAAAAAESSRLAALKAGQDAAAALLAQQQETAKLTKIEAYTTAKGAYAITSGGLIQQYRSGTLDETNFNTQNTSAYAPVQTAFDATVAAGITGLSAPSKLAIAAVDTAARLLDTYLKDKAVLDGYIARGVQAVKSNPYGVSPIIMLNQTNTVAADLDAYRTASRAAGLVPAYATGGDHFGGWRIVGENGPELEATGQSRIFNADQTRKILSSGQADNREMVGELKALRDEIKQLRSEQKAGNIAIAENTGKTARQLSRWDGDGTPPVRDAA